jgi:hypothetical protein
MAFQDLTDGDGRSKNRDRLIAVYIGVLAVALAICSLGGGNATKDATTLNIQASNTWAFFQAKNIRRNDVRLQIDMLELRLSTEPGLAPEARAVIEGKIKGYKQQEARLSSEPDTGEGVKELLAKGKALEVQRDIAMRKDPYFDYAQALLQIAVVLASVSIITGGTVLLLFSGILATGGVLLAIDGFTLFLTLPWIG